MYLLGSGGNRNGGCITWKFEYTRVDDVSYGVSWGFPLPTTHMRRTSFFGGAEMHDGGGAAVGAAAAAMPALETLL